MRRKMKVRIIIVAAAVLLAAVTALWYVRGARLLLDRSAELNGLVDAILSKNGITKADLVRESREEKSLGGRRYIRSRREYIFTKEISIKVLGGAIDSALKKTPYKVKSSDYALGREREIASLAIGYRAFEVFSLKLTRDKTKRLPAVSKKFPNPKVAVVLDDFGYSMKGLDDLFRMNIPVTFSILPNRQYSSKISEEAVAKGCEAILHLPLEPYNAEEAKGESDLITVEMPRNEVLARLDRAVASVPKIDGVSNHMGSRATENVELMSTILDYVKGKNLFYLDSLVTEKSVCERLAGQKGVRFAKRAIFLDNEKGEEYVRGQLYKMRAMAYRTGAVVAIGHAKEATIKVLCETLPALKRDGIKFVRVSDMAR